MPQESSLSFRPAISQDIDELVALINRAYRGEASRVGWTSEADLLTGDRITRGEAEALIAKAETVILLALQGTKILGTVELERKGRSAYLGMLVIDPELQAKGLGKQLLAAAEEFVIRDWESQNVFLRVISVRESLIAFYERRGYIRTGEVQSLPPQLGQSRPVVEGLNFETMRKRLNA